MFELVAWPRSNWSLFDDYDDLGEEVNRIFTGRGFDSAARYPRYAYPPVNVWSSGDGVIIDAELPGVDPADVNISVTGNELTISGKVNAAASDEAETCIRRERPSGEFARTLRLSFQADAAAVKAQYKNGVLRLTVPRPEREKPRKIAIEAG